MRHPARHRFVAISTLRGAEEFDVFAVGCLIGYQEAFRLGGDSRRQQKGEEDKDTHAETFINVASKDASAPHDIAGDQEQRAPASPACIELKITFGRVIARPAKASDMGVLMARFPVRASRGNSICYPSNLKSRAYTIGQRS